MPQFSIDASEADFDQSVLEASFHQPVLVDFWAPWCGPCQSLKPILERLAEEYGGRFVLARINSDENPELARQFGVRSIPSVKVVANGEIIDEFSGALPEGQVRAFIDRLLPSPVDPLRAEAASFLAAGDADGALARLGQAAAIAPDDEDVRLDTAEILVDLGRSDQAKELLAGEYRVQKARAQALSARLQFADVGGDETEFATRLASDPNDHDARLGLARLLGAHGEYRPALEHLLEIVTRDRSFADGAARKTMLTIFDAMSSDPDLDDLIREFRRRLAAALN